MDASGALPRCCGASQAASLEGNWEAWEVAGKSCGLLGGLWDDERPDCQRASAAAALSARTAACNYTYVHVEVKWVNQQARGSACQWCRNRRFGRPCGALNNRVPAHRGLVPTALFGRPSGYRKSVTAGYSQRCYLTALGAARAARRVRACCLSWPRSRRATIS